MDRSPFIFKIKYGDILRRIAVWPPSRRYGFVNDVGPDITLIELENKIRKDFKIPVTSELVLVYSDTENDMVTMVDNNDIRDACVCQKLNPVRVTVLVQESQHSAHSGHPPESVAADPPPPWAADIILKLDQLLLAVNGLVKPEVESASAISTTTEQHVLEGLDVPPTAGPTIEPARDFPPSEERRFDIAQPGYDSEFLRRAMILRQRVITDELSTEDTQA